MTIMQTDRTLLTYEILSRTPYGIAVSDTYEAFTLANNDPKIGIDRLIANGVFQAAYPLHDALREHLNREQKKNDREVESLCFLFFFYFMGPVSLINLFLLK